MECTTCGAHITNDKCPFESSKSWQGDYRLIGSGEMAYPEHRLRVARWMLHHPEDFSSGMLKWARSMLGMLVSA
ncbi:MAG: hypothetical protein SP1CHLAM54_11580 [Chlamydiia bacterium]|nr:hypothetical protein [Chlamydiia bacterium]MCH9616061.1 hypothetical protein [Chlamydiia bacterium]MCH9629084.1 hypothetical protein [Chlamydiia bacterium]